MTLTTKVKRLDDGGQRIGGYGAVFGDAENCDLEGTYFSAETNFWLDNYSNQPLIYDHAMNTLPVDMPGDMPEHFVYGHVIKATIDSVGVWIEAQIDQHNEWVQAVLDLIDKGVLHWSSGSVPHLITQERDGRLSSWPIIEMSTTPTPAEPRKTEVVRLKHYVNHQDAAQTPHEAAPEKGEQGVTRDTPDVSISHMEPDNGRGNLMNIKKKAAALVELNWESIQDAVKQGNAIEELAQPLADQLAELTGMTSEEALAIIVGIIAERAGSAPVEEPPAPEDGAEMMDAPTLNVDMDALADAVAKKVMATNASSQPKGGFLVRNINVNLNREDKQPHTLARYIRAMRDHDKAYLDKRQAAIRARYKAMGINPDTAGGYLVEDEQSTQVIERLEEVAKVFPLCRQFPMGNGTLRIPKVTGGVTTYWTAENSLIQDSDVDLGEITLAPKKLTAMVKVSNELLRNPDPSVDGIIRDDIGRAFAVAIDKAILEGSGLGNEPRGLANIADITKTAINGVPTYAQLLGAKSRVEVANSNESPEWRWVFHSREKLWLSQVDDDRGGYIWAELGSNQAMVGGYPLTLHGSPYTTTNSIAIDTDNNSETRMYYGQWDDVVVGLSKTMEIVASAEAGDSFAYDQTWIRAMLLMDVNIRHDESIEILTDVRAS